VSLGEALNFVPVFALVLFRLAGMMLFAPLFGSAKIPRRVKLLIALIMALTMCSAIDARKVEIPETMWGLTLGIGGELGFGLALGTIVSFVFIAAQWAGEIIGQQMGLNISEVLDPQFGQAGSLVGDLYFMLAMVVFLSPAVNGHHALVRGVRASFDAVPLMSAGMNANLLDVLVGLFQSSAALAIQLAAPMLMTMLIVDVALGCIGRAMPQMNVMAIGLSVRSLLGVAVLVAGLYLTTQVMENVHKDWGETSQAQWTAPGN